MFCTNCGKEVADGALFCTSCGTKIAQVSDTQSGTAQPVNTTDSASSHDSPQPAQAEVSVPVTDTPKKKANTGILVAIGAAVVVLAIIIFSGGSGYKDYKKLAIDYYKAINNKDVNAMIKLFDKDVQKELKKDKDDIQDELEDMKDDMQDYYGRGWNRDIKPGVRERSSKKDTYTVEIEIDGEFHEYLYIKKDGDKYYIHEDYIDF